MRSHFLRAPSGPIYIGSTVKSAFDLSAPYAMSASLPAGVLSGDLLLAFICSGQTTTSFTESSGTWTEGLDSNNRALYYKTAGASESDPTFNSSADGTFSIIIVAYRRASFDLVGSQSIAASPTVAPAITLSSGNSVVVAFYSRTSGSTTFSTPSGYSAVASDSDSNGSSTALFHEFSVPAGSTGTASSTPSGGTARGFLVGIKPS